MELYVKIEDNLFLNPVNGDVKKDVRHSIPLILPIATRKIKPSLKFAKKVGDVWIGSNKMSFLLVLAYAMLKQGKSRVIGFYKDVDRYIYIEGSADIHKTVFLRYGFLSPNETPDTFIAVEGKIYDGIFGDNDLKNVDLNFQRAYKELTQRVNPIHLGIILISFILTGYLAYDMFLKKPIQITPPPILQKEPPPPPPLTAEETDRFLLVLKDNFIDKYAEVQSLTERDKTRWLRNVQFKTIKEPQSVTAEVIFTHSSFYPYVGYRKEANDYISVQSYNEKLGREDLEKYAIYEAQVSSYPCLKYLINYEVTERNADRWVVLLQEKKYDRIAFLLNLISKCPVVIRELSIDTNNLMATVEVITDGR